MSLTLPIIVYGNGDLYREIFNAIATVMHNSGYRHLIKLSILLTGTWAILRFSEERSFSGLLKWLGAYYFSFFILFYPTATVEILDQVNQGKGYTVDNVPLGIAVMSSYTSRIGGGLTELTDEIFSLPDDLKYSQTGMVMASRLVVNASQFQMTDPSFMQSMQGFVHQCVFYDILLNRYTLNDLLGQKDVWQYLSDNASKARSFLYYPPQNAEGIPSVVTCETGAKNLTSNWNNALDQTAALYGARLFPMASDPKAQLLSDLPIAYNFLTQTSLSATDILKQNIMSNAIQNGIVQMGATVNAPAALEDYALTKAQLQKRLTNETAGDMAAYWLPLMKNVIEAVLYGSFIFIFLLIMFPFGGAILKNYLGSLLWLQMWGPLYAILNLCMSFYAEIKTLGAMGVHGQMGLNLYSQAGIAQVNADISGLAGYMSLSIPLLAYGLVRGMSSVFSQAAQYIAGVTQGAASSASAEATSGNYSMGNISYNNLSSFNTSANHFDTSGRVSSGMYTTQMAGGSTLTETADGSTVMNNQGAISNLGVLANLGESIRASYMKQADAAETAGYNQLKASSDSTAAAIRNIYELGSNTGMSKSSGENWSLSTNSSVNDAISDIHRKTDQFAHSHNISYGEASSVLGSAYAEGHVGVKAGGALSSVVGLDAGASAGYKRSSDNTESTSHNALYNDAKSFVNEGSFSHSVNVVQNAVHNQSLQSSNQEAHSLIQNIGSSLDQAQALRTEASSSFQQAQSYRESATLAQEDSANITSNASQVVYESLSKQGMSPGQIEELVTHHPDEAISKASGALQTYTANLEQGWSHGLAGSSDAVEQQSHEYDKHIKTKDTIKSENRAGDNQVRVEASKDSKELLNKNIVDENLKTKVQHDTNERNTEVQQNKNSTKKEINQFEQKEKLEVNKKRAGASAKNWFTGVDTKDD